jgi:hypothetical protein
LHCVTRSVGVAGHARRDAGEDVEVSLRWPLAHQRDVFRHGASLDELEAL